MSEPLHPPTRVPVLAGTVPAAAKTPASAGRRVAGRRETLVFRAAMAVVGFALVDDAFVHPETGTSAGDHLASGLVPLAIAVVLALAYPRLRAGAARRRRTRVRRAGGDRGDGGRIPPRRHRPDRRRRCHRHARRCRRRRAARRSGCSSGGAHAGSTSARSGATRAERSSRSPLSWSAVFVVLPMAFAIVATHRAREPVEAVDLGRPYERVSFTTSDGLRLAGWYVPSRNRAAVIVSPGAGAGRARADARASRLRRAAVRPPRRGRERGRLQRVRLGRRRRPQGSRDLPRAPRRRRLRADRWPRPVGRRRDDARDRRGRPAAARGRVRGRQRALGAPSTGTSPDLAAVRKPFTPMLCRRWR